MMTRAASAGHMRPVGRVYETPDLGVFPNHLSLPYFFESAEIFRISEEYRFLKNTTSINKSFLNSMI